MKNLYLILLYLMIFMQMFWLVTINSYNMISNVFLFIIYGMWSIFFYCKIKKIKNEQQ